MFIKIIKSCILVLNGYILARIKLGMFKNNIIIAEKLLLRLYFLKIFKFEINR